jgi:hypothetical protein
MTNEQPQIAQFKSDMADFMVNSFTKNKLEFLRLFSGSTVSFRDEKLNYFKPVSKDQPLQLDVYNPFEAWFVSNWDAWRTRSKSQPVAWSASSNIADQTSRFVMNFTTSDRFGLNTTNGILELSFTRYYITRLPPYSGNTESTEPIFKVQEFFFRKFTRVETSSNSSSSPLPYLNVDLGSYATINNAPCTLHWVLNSDTEDSTDRKVRAAKCAKPSDPDVTYFNTDVGGLSFNLVGQMEIHQLSDACLKAFIVAYPQYAQLCCMQQAAPTLAALLCTDYDPAKPTCDAFMAEYCTGKNTPECACYQPLDQIMQEAGQTAQEQKTLQQVADDYKQTYSVAPAARCLIPTCKKGTAYLNAVENNANCTSICNQLLRVVNKTDYSYVDIDTQQTVSCFNNGKKANFAIPKKTGTTTYVPSAPEAPMATLLANHSAAVAAFIKNCISQRGVANTLALLNGSEVAFRNTYYYAPTEKEDRVTNFTVTVNCWLYTNARISFLWRTIGDTFELLQDNQQPLRLGVTYKDAQGNITQTPFGTEVPLPTTILKWQGFSDDSVIIGTDRDGSPMEDVSTRITATLEILQWSDASAYSFIFFEPSQQYVLFQQDATRFLTETKTLLAMLDGSQVAFRIPSDYSYGDEVKPSNTYYEYDGIWSTGTLDRGTTSLFEWRTTGDSFELWQNNSKVGSTFRLEMTNFGTWQYKSLELILKSENYDIFATYIPTPWTTAANNGIPSYYPQMVCLLEVIQFGSVGWDAFLAQYPRYESLRVKYVEVVDTAPPLSPPLPDTSLPTHLYIGAGSALCVLLIGIGMLHAIRSHRGQSFQSLLYLIPFIVAIIIAGLGVLAQNGLIFYSAKK